MNYSNHALNTYRETSVKTASQGSLIIMLYDEAIRQIGHAVELMKEEKILPANIEKINTHILKTQEIVTELMASLDMVGGGEIAENLLSIYSFFNQQLLQANIKKQKDPLVEVRSMMEELRKAWQEVVSTTAPGQTQPVSTGVNIAG